MNSEQTPNIKEKNYYDQKFIEDRNQNYQLENKVLKQSKRDNFKQLKNPIQKSKDLLKQVVNYWLQGNNQYLLNSKKWSKYVNDDTQFYRRQYLEQNVFNYMNGFSKLEPDFSQKEGKYAQNLQLDEYKEYAKQCFYINIYNSLILYKLAELSCFNPKSIFKLNTHSSWLALEQNTRISIASHNFTAYQIKLQVVKNQCNSNPSNYSVNQNLIHPLIDFAFFMPRNGMMNLKNLIFKDVSDLIKQFPINLKQQLENKIVIKADLNLILMPCYMKSILSKDDVITPLQLYMQNVRQSQSHNQIYKEVSQQLLQFIKQQQILSILKFIQWNIINSDNQQSELEKQIKIAITKIEIGISKYKVSMDEKLIDNVEECPLTQYNIEFISIDFVLKPEKIYDGMDLDLFQDKYDLGKKIVSFEESKN